MPFPLLPVDDDCEEQLKQHWFHQGGMKHQHSVCKNPP
jgi:hypothetical protein